MNIHAALFISSLTVSLTAHAGVVIGGTRFIYPEGADSITFEVKNTSSDTYLVNTKVTQESGNAPFITTPPLFPISSGDSNKIRIIRSGGNFPNDRESLFHLNIAAIPAGKASSNSLQIAVKSRMKLFYRPESLRKGAVDAWQELEWSHTNGAWQVRNPSPYYITLSQLKVNNLPNDAAIMLAPFEQQRFTGCEKSQPCSISWRSINDYGALTPVCHAQISGDKLRPNSCETNEK